MWYGPFVGAMWCGPFVDVLALLLPYRCPLRGGSLVFWGDVFVNAFVRVRVLNVSDFWYRLYGGEVKICWLYGEFGSDEELVSEADMFLI